MADPEQDRQWMDDSEFEVIGCDTGRRYCITQSKTMNVCELDKNGHTSKRWCFVPDGPITTTGDILLAQKVALETMESEALAVANKFRGT